MLMVGFTGVLSYCMQHPHEEPASSPISSLLPLLKKMHDQKQKERVQAQTLLAKLQATVIETGPSINAESRAPSPVQSDRKTP
jgi:hypothetical protein